MILETMMRSDIVETKQPKEFVVNVLQDVIDLLNPPPTYCTYPMMALSHMKNLFEKGSSILPKSKKKERTQLLLVEKKILFYLSWLESGAARANILAEARNNLEVEYQNQLHLINQRTAKAPTKKIAEMTT